MFRFTDLIIFRLTRGCNLNCKYCFMQNKEEYKNEKIDFELFKKIIDRIIEQRLINSKHTQLSLVFHGGEFLTIGKKSLYEILEYTTAQMNLNNIDCELGCQTNGVLLDDEIAKILSKFSVGIGLSFDGVNGSNDLRDIKQEIFESKFEILKKNKNNFGFLIIANKSNIDKIQDSQDYIKKLNRTNGYKINYSEDMINPGENSEIEVSGKEMFEKVFKPELLRILKGEQPEEHNTKELLTKAIIDILSYHENGTKSGCGTKWCGAGISMIAIEPDGEMDYCDRYSKKFSETYIQHALDYDFLGIYQLNKMIQYNKMKAKLYNNYECDTCYADYICNHGCESFYYSKYGEYGIDTRLVCDQYKMFYSFVLENIVEFVKKREIVSYANDTIIKIRPNINYLFFSYGIDLIITDDKKSIIIKRT